MNKVCSYNVLKESQTEFLSSDSWVEIDEFLKSKYSRVIYVVDKALEREFKDLDSNSLFISGGENSKTMESFQVVLKRLSDKKLDRNSVLVAIGGGSISDLLGFISSVYLRGISYAVIPTTLLNIVDASIGGKNGINFGQKKNQIGTIYQPDFIFLYQPIIKTIPKQELSNGFAEIIKYAITLDAKLFDTLVGLNLDDVTSNYCTLEQIINSCIMHKSTIVQKDPFEVDLRKVLNFGHTVGHAIESLTSLSHGPSVGLGMIIATEISHIHFKSDENYSNKLRRVLTQFELPVTCDKINSEILFEKIEYDKKRVSDSLHFVMLAEVGDVRLEKLSLAQIKDYLDRAENEKWIFK